MIIAKSILLRSPSLQRVMCALGFHWWRAVMRRNNRLYLSHCVLTLESQENGEFTTYRSRCRFCGKEDGCENPRGL